MKIGIFTPYPLAPLHPRTEMIAGLLRGNEHDVTIVSNNCKKNSIWYFLSLLSLKHFDISSLPDLISQLEEYDIIFIQDLQNLPLAYFAKKRNKIVIYETLDNNVHLRFYYLLKRYPLFNYFAFLVPLFENIEKFLAFHYTHQTIVNSHALEAYFLGRAEIIFYASPHEALTFFERPKKKLALLYLGIISEEKGFFEMLDLQERLGCKLFLYGTCSSQLISDKIDSRPELVWKTRLASDDLANELTKLAQEYFLVGVSLVKSVNHSYATQELNKDIDYLAMGVPIIGNHRHPTEEKILAGCGVFAEDLKRVRELLDTPEIQSQISKKCKEYYFNNYSQSIFENKLLQIVECPYDR